MGKTIRLNMWKRYEYKLRKTVFNSFKHQHNFFKKHREDIYSQPNEWIWLQLKEVPNESCKYCWVPVEMPFKTYDFVTYTKSSKIEASRENSWMYGMISLAYPDVESSVMNWYRWRYQAIRKEMDNMWIDFNVKNPAVWEYMRERSTLQLSDYKGSVTRTTKGWIINIFQESYKNWDSVADIQKKINALDENLFSMSRAKMIATNESHKAFEYGNAIVMNEAYQQGADVIKMRSTVWDSKVTDYCLDNEADWRIPFDQPHTGGDDIPPGHVNCRCTELYEIKNVPWDVNWEYEFQDRPEDIPMPLQPWEIVMDLAWPQTMISVPAPIDKFPKSTYIEEDASQLNQSKLRKVENWERDWLSEDSLAKLSPEQALKKYWIDSKEYTAVLQYTEEDAWKINKSLRWLWWKDMEWFANVMDSALEKLPQVEWKTLWRWITMEVESPMYEKMYSLKKWDILTDSAFTSTTTSKEWANFFAQSIKWSDLTRQQIESNNYEWVLFKYQKADWTSIKDISYFGDKWNEIILERWSKRKVSSIEELDLASDLREWEFVDGADYWSIPVREIVLTLVKWKAIDNSKIYMEILTQSDKEWLRYEKTSNPLTDIVEQITL